MPSAPSGTSFTSVSVAGAWRQKDLGSAKRFVSWSRQTYGNVGEASWTVVGSNDQNTWYIVDRQTGRNTTTRTETGTVNPSYSQYSYRYYRWITEAAASAWPYTMSHIFHLRDENGAFLSTDGAFTGSTGAGDEISYDSSTVFSFSGDISWLHSSNYNTTGVYTGPTVTVAYDPTSPSGPPVTPPSAPTSLEAVAAGDLGVSVSFTPGADGGSAITNYEYSINDGSSYTAFSPSNTSSPVVISGLAYGQSYTIKLRAVNSAGTGAASSSLAYTVPEKIIAYVNTGAQFSKAGIVVSYTDDTGAAATQNVTFANKTLSMDSGLNVSAGNAYLAGAAQIHGAAKMDSTLDVTGAGRFRNALIVDGTFNMGGALNVAGAATMGSTLAVTGATNLNNTLAVAGAASLNSTLAVTGASNLNNTLAVTGAASMNSTLAVAGASNLNNTLAVAGAASLNSSLAVIGVTTLTGALDVKAASHLENTLLVDGAASLGAALTVSGAATLNNGMTVNGTSTHNGALVVSGAASAGGAIAVTGAATLNSSLNAKGASRLEDVLVVDGAASLGSSLAVAGAASVVGAMDVTGASRLRNSAQIDGAATLGSSLAVTGATSMASTLDVTGASRLRNNVVVDGTASMGSSLAVTGAASLSSSLVVTGAANLNNTLAVTGAANLNNTLAVSGAASMASTLAVTGAANLNNTLAVTGAANLNNTLAVSGAASLSSSLAVTGAASMSNTLAVTGAATFQNNVTVNGNLTVLGSQTAIDTTSLQVKDNAILLADGNEADVLQTGIQLQYKPSGASAVKYAGVKRQPTTGEFVFFKDSAKQIDDPTVGVSGTEFIVSPQKSGLSSNTWTQNDITYTTTASSYVSNNGNYPAYAPFNNYYGQSVVYSWASDAQYDISSGSYTGGASTTVLGGVGAVNGEWLQIQLSAPMAMDSYSFACGSIAHLPRQYYIVGSNDGSAWNPVQYGEMSSNPFTTGFTTGGSAINVNQSGVQSIHGPEDPQTGSGNFTTYPTTGTKYSYYRIVAKAIYGASSGSGGLLELNEWYINFLSSTTATLPSSYTVEWKNLGGASFNNMTINQSVTTSLENINYKFMHRCQGYNLPAGTYNYSASATNHDNYWDPFLLINEYGATLVTVSTGVAPWSTQSSLTGTFTLAKPSMVYSKKTSNQYYAYDTNLRMTLTRTAPASAPVAVSDIYAVVMADSFNSASDVRLKRDIVPLEGALDKIDAIRGVQYHWIDGEQSESRQVGVIAQEIQEVYPELVREGGNGFLSVDYPKLTAVLIESIKELKAMAMALMNK